MKLLISKLFKKYSNLLQDILIIVLLGSIPLIWFTNNHYVIGSDAIYPLDVVNFFKNLFFTWTIGLPLGQDASINMGTIIINGIEAFFNAVGFSIFDAQKLTFIFWFIAMGLSMYFFVYSFRKIFNLRYFPLIASILYVFNFYLLALWRLGAGTTFSAYTALPLIALLFIKVILRQVSPIKAGILISLVLFLFSGGGGTSLPLYGGIIITLITAFAFFLVISSNNERIKIISRTCVLAITTAALSFFLSAYWIFPMIPYVHSNYNSGVAAQGGIGGIIKWVDSVSQHTSIINLFRLQGFPDWYNNINHAYSNYFLQNPFLIFFSFLFAFFAYLSLWFVREREQKKIIVFLVVLSLVAIFFSAGTHSPTGPLFIFLMEHIPFFVIFRSAQYKFVPALYFAFAILISYTINVLIEKRKNFKFFRFKIVVPKKLLAAGIIGLILLYHFPFFGKDFFVWNKPLTTLLRIPDYVYRYEDWSKNNLNDESRMLLLPRLNSTWKLEVYTWKLFSSLSLFNLISTKPIMENSGGLNDGQYALINRLYDEILNNGPHISDIASLLETPFALLRNDSYYNLSWIPSESPSLYRNALEKSKFISSVWRDGEWDVYGLPFDDNHKLYGLKDVTEFIGEEGAITGAVVAGSNNFFYSTPQNGQFTGVNLPIDGMIYSLPCESCILEKNLDLPALSSAGILPDSPFYFIKEWKERSVDNQNLDTKQLMVNRLGLSVKRVSEMSSLINKNANEDLISKTNEKILGYWNFINTYVDNTVIKDKQTDFSLVRTLQAYIKLERPILIKLYDAVGPGNLQQEIGSTIWKINSTNKSINTVIRGNDWSRVKEFAVPNNLVQGEMYIDALSLDKRSNGSLLVPNKIQINQSTFSVKAIDNREKISLGLFDLSGASSIKLFFPQPSNLFINRHKQNIYFADSQMNCIVGDISGFSWKNTYKVIYSVNPSLAKNAMIYINVKNVGKINKYNNNYFYPTSSYAVDTNNATQEYITIVGSDGDTSASVYYCQNTIDNPEQSLKSLNIENITTPQVFFIPKDKSNVNARVQKISYTRIDSTKYSMKLHTNSPMVVTFNEAFNPLWRLYEVDGKISPWSFAETLFKKPVFNNTHFEIYDFANAWYINKSFDGKLIVEFYPQQLFYEGLILSSITILLLSGFCLIYKISRKGKKNEEVL